jgi:IS30 family transposase
MHTAPSHYCQLQPEDRATLAGLMHRNHSFSVISRVFHCSNKIIRLNFLCSADASGDFRAQAQRCRQDLQQSVKSQSSRHAKARFLNPAYHVTLKHRFLEKINLTQPCKRLKKAHQIRVPYARINSGIFPQQLKNLCLKLVANLPLVLSHVGRSENSQSGRSVPLWLLVVLQGLFIKKPLNYTLTD